MNVAKIVINVMKKIKNQRYKGKSKKTAKHFSGGGMLLGPSHEQGGIQAIVDGTEPIEVEGGEFIINKQTVDAVGEEFLHKLNSTETTHHTGGFNEGVLPSPSKFKDGGKVNNRRSKMARGRRAPRRGTAPARGMRRGGRSTGRKMAAGGRACGGMGQPPCNGGGYRRGGRTRPVTSRRVKMARGGATRVNRRYQTGGNAAVGHNSACTMHASKYDCHSTPGCHWSFQQDRCH